MTAPGLMRRIEADQHGNVHLRVSQAEVQLTGHKRSLNGQKPYNHNKHPYKKPDLSRVTYREATGNANEQHALLSLAGLVANADAFSSTLKTKVQ